MSAQKEEMGPSALHMLRFNLEAARAAFIRGSDEDERGSAAIETLSGLRLLELALENVEDLEKKEPAA